MKRIYPLDKLGWPVVRIKGRPLINLIRLLIHTRRLTTKRPRCLDSTPNEFVGYGITTPDDHPSLRAENATLTTALAEAKAAHVVLQEENATLLRQIRSAYRTGHDDAITSAEWPCRKCSDKAIDTAARRPAARHGGGVR